MTPPVHGGRLQAAAQEFNIPLNEWLDLSTGINPTPWPVPELPMEVWQRLPDSYGGLDAAAKAYFGQSMLALPGSQWAIQNLPRVLPSRRVLLPEQAYEEHRYWWQFHDHQTAFYGDAREIDFKPHDVLVIINPNNPTAKLVAPDKLLALAEQLAAKKGYLVVDEAFIDCTPEWSLLASSDSLPNNLVVLRSLGKFFGLAGIRLGFIYCNTHLRNTLEHLLGPWSISHPAAYIGELALLDQQWHEHTRQNLHQTSNELVQLLQQHFDSKILASTSLFATLQLDALRAETLYRHCAEHGILVRWFPQWGKVRIGLTTKQGQNRLNATLKCWDF